jgi:hypothetical protein
MSSSIKVYFGFGHDNEKGVALCVRYTNACLPFCLPLASGRALGVVFVMVLAWLHMR